MSILRTVRPIHFEDFGGAEFERLVLAYHVRAGWQEVQWYGQTGSDQGRDIIAIEPFDDRPPRRTVIQCVNRDNLTKTKAEDDIRKAVKASTGPPDAFKFVCRGDVSASRRDWIVGVAKAACVQHIVIWSGVEFEEQLRIRADDVLRRFFEGEPFPDSAEEIKRFVDDFPGLTDEEALALMGCVFDRPAFRVPFHSESSLPSFLKAIDDTIAALNVGIWRARDGAEIRRIPSWHNLRDPTAAATVRNTVSMLDKLRRIFVEHLKRGSITHCVCGQLDCPVFMVQQEAALELDTLRHRILSNFQSVSPDFDVRLT